MVYYAIQRHTGPNVAVPKMIDVREIRASTICLSRDTLRPFTVDVVHQPRETEGITPIVFARRTLGYHWRAFKKYVGSY